LTDETTDLLYRLGEQDRIVGISAFTRFPPEARKQKPRIATYTDAQIPQIMDLKPDLVLGFSDLQADIAQQLIRKGISVWITNPRSVAEIEHSLIQIASLVNKTEEAMHMVKRLQERREIWKADFLPQEKRVRVYFEEWYDPLITGIQWVGELIELAGGRDVFAELREESLAGNRIISPKQVIEKNPDLIIGSWCGKPFKPKRLYEREGWTQICALQTEQVFEIQSSLLLQPGLVALDQGLQEMRNLISRWESL